MIRISDVADTGSNAEILDKHNEIMPSGRMTDQEADAFWKAEFQKVHDEVGIDEYDILLSEAFNRSEEELDIVFDIDDKTMTIVEQFSPESWDALDDVERASAVKELVTALGEGLELPDIPDTIVFDNPSDAYGFYDPSNNTINLNKQFFDDPIELLNTIAHEVRHAYQEYRAGLLETREDALFRVNLDNYISPFPLPDGGWLFFTDYQDQYVEVDARAFANLFTEAINYE